jgi:hypothetical protein
MKLHAVITIALATAATTFAAQHKLVVCSEIGNGFVISRAQSVAGTVYSAIGTHIDWRRPSSCPADAIHITYSYETPRDLMPGAWAYAKPYEGIHIVVFYDRILNLYGPELFPTVLGYAMAHEIGHILEGVKRHSETGIMKANWTPDEIKATRFHPMAFADEDVDLIDKGLEARANLATLR